MKMTTTVLTVTLASLIGLSTFGFSAKQPVCPAPSPQPVVTVTASPLPAPTITVTATPAPAPTVTVTALPEPAPTVTVTATPSPVVVPVPGPTVTVTPSCPSPTPSPTISPSPTPSVSPKPSVTPSPTVSPAPSVTPSPTGTSAPGVLQVAADGVDKPAPGEAISWLPSWTAAGSRGEVLSTKFQTTAGSCHALVLSDIGPVTVSAFEMKTVPTTQRSFAGARVGEHYDPLLPVTQVCPGKLYWLDLQIKEATAPGQYALALSGLPISLKVWNTPVLGRIPSFPMYMELTGQQVMVALGNSPSSNIAVQGPATQLFNELYRSHRIEPIKQDINLVPAIANGVVNVNNWSGFNASFKQLVLDGRIAPPMILRWLPDRRYTQTELAAIEASIVQGILPRGSWAYVKDEHEFDGSYGGRPDTLLRASEMFQWSPGLEPMLTWQESADLKPFIKWFSPVLSIFKMPGFSQTYTQPYWLYWSCMAQGSCATGGATPDGTPMAVVEASSAHFIAAPVVSYAMGATRGLYYTGTKMITTGWTNIFNEGGNGDGTVVYAAKPGQFGNVQALAVPSIRLKEWRQASYLIEYMAEAKKRGIEYKSPVTNSLTWSKNRADYEAARLQIGTAMDSSGTGLIVAGLLGFAAVAGIGTAVFGRKKEENVG